MTRWTRYWFAEGGRLGAAIVRIAIALAVLGALWRLSGTPSSGDLPGEHTLYRPVGVWMLLGHTPPPDALVDALWAIALAGTVAMLAGIASRASCAVSFVAALALASLSYASSRSWSHQYNVVFLAQAAFLGARSGDVLSIDALIRRVRGLPARDVPRGYQWSLRLVQLAVALMFAGAAVYKLAHGHFTLRWALSDNLRHQLLVKYDLAGLPRPPLVDWLIDDPWRYRTAAVLNLISQAAPLAACFLVKRPVLRALCGAFFVIETIALGLVVDLWNPWWLPLYAVFVDWDALLRRPPPAGDAPPPRAARWYVIAFVVYDAVIVFVPGLAQVANTYPFTNFPMFSSIRAREPYSEHQPYAVATGHFEVFANAPAPPYVQEWFDHTNRTTIAARAPDELHRRLAAIVAQAQHRWPDFGIRGVRLWLTIYEAPAVPAPAHFVAHPLAIVAELQGGVFRCELGRAPPVRSYAGDRVEPVAAGDDWTYGVADVDGQPWLVERR
ncbi:MAG: hypothetical protein ACM31C_33565 [Acidobacteriota bacterium]